jgi:LuxR family maltose regulon positive regulatory protein
MDLIFLQAKLHRPPPPPASILRPELLQQLNNGIHARVSLVAAPAGFGKSTLISAWFDQLEALPPAADGQPPLVVGWLSLEESDNQLPRFIRYLVMAIEEKYPQSCEAVLALLLGNASVTVEALTDVLANVLAQLPRKLVLALDDLHLVNDPAIFALLTRLIQHVSGKVHLVLIARRDPPLPLSRWRAHGQLNEVRLQQLSFSREETVTFLRGNLTKMPTPEMIDVLYERTEGWAVGLRLVALALQGSTDYGALIESFQANSNRFIFDYLVDDVLDKQPPALQQFLVATSILGRFCPALCAAVLEIEESAAQRFVADLAQANLFIIEVSSPAYWYRYHHQFQSLLLSRLHERYDQQAVETFHRQAARWLIAHHQVDEALRHLKTIRDDEAIADLIESLRIHALNAHQFHELEQWLTFVPAAHLNRRPALLIGLAWLHQHRLEYTQCLATVQRAEAALHAQAETLPVNVYNLLAVELVALRVVADRSLTPEQALALSAQSWEQARTELAGTHCQAVIGLALANHLLAGNELALHMLTTALEQTSEWPPMARARLYYSYGIVYLYRCNLVMAEREFQQGLHIAKQFGLPLATLLCNFGLGLIADNRNQPELAEQFHLKVVREPHYQDGLRAVLSTYSLIGLYAARGQPEAGTELVSQLKAQAVMIGRPYLLSQVAALEAYLALVQGDLPTALAWAVTGVQGEMYSASDRVPLIRALILIAEASPAGLHEAEHILSDLRRRHEAEHDLLFAIEVMILQVVVWDRLDESASALAALERLVQLAVPNGVIGPLIAQGPRVQRLLTKLKDRPGAAPLVARLLAAFPEPQGAASHTVAPRIVSIEKLVDPLTEREFDLLKLLAERLSNKEIAQRLVISTHTVRNHASNIFGKLQVDNRFEAVERAREIGLLPVAKQASDV